MRKLIAVKTETFCGKCGNLLRLKRKLIAVKRVPHFLISNKYGKNLRENT